MMFCFMYVVFEIRGQVKVVLMVTNFKKCRYL